MKKFIVIIISFIVLSGCTQIDIRKIDAQRHAIKHVCISKNSKVNVTDFIQVLEDKFIEHGITSEVYEDRASPESCKFIVKYTAKRSWDITFYIGYAEINVYEDRIKIGSATYKQTGGSGSLSLNKWGTTMEKIGPVLDDLLSKFSGQQPIERGSINKVTNNKQSSNIKRLTELKKLYDSKLIEKIEYEKKKKDILNNL